MFVQRSSFFLKVDKDSIKRRCKRKHNKQIIKGAGRIGSRRTNRGHPTYIILKISQNTEKSLGDLMRLAVIQVPVKDHQLALVGKTLEGVR